MTLKFGSNKNNQGAADFSSSKQDSLALQRLRALQSQYGELLNPYFTGDTGFGNDADRYSKLLNARSEYIGLGNLLNSKRT